MKIWLLQSSEPMPIVNPDMRLLRTGMMAEKLVENGHDVTWFNNSFDHFTKTQMFNKDTIIKVKDNYALYLPYGIKYKRNISISRIINHMMLAKKFKKISRSMEKPDLIYASFPTIDYAYEAVKYGQKNNVPVIIDIRDLWPDIFNHNLPKILAILASPYIKYMDIKTKYIMRNCFAINATADAMLDWGLKKANRSKQKYDRYFYIGYDKDLINDVDRKSLINRKKFNISFFATINNQFNYNLIYELAIAMNKKDKDVIFNICGDGPQFTLLKEKLKNLNNVKLFGWTKKQDLQNILLNSDVGLAPYKDTFDFRMSVSNKFTEYLAYGLPVIITCDGNMKKILKVNNCGLGSQDVNKLCKYILKLKKDKKVYKLESENARKLYEENFMATKIYREIVNYIEEIGDEK